MLTSGVFSNTSASNNNHLSTLDKSECSQFGYDFQKKYHIPKLPVQTIHVKAENMGHNMLTLNPKCSINTIGKFICRYRENSSTQAISVCGNVEYL